MIDLIRRIAVFCALFLLICFCQGSAHPPIEILVEKDLKHGQLRISVIHPVNNPRQHYVRKVEVSIDNQQLIEKKFFFQKANKQCFQVNVDNLAKVKTLKVNAYSNKGGELEKEFVFKERE